MKAALRVTTFHDRRTVELHQRYDEIERARFRLRVAQRIEHRNAMASVTSIFPMVSVFRRQAD